MRHWERQFTAVYVWFISGQYNHFTARLFIDAVSEYEIEICFDGEWFFKLRIRSTWGPLKYGTPRSSNTITLTSQIISRAIVYSTVYSGADRRKHQSSASLATVQGIHRWPVNSPLKRPVTREMFPFDGVTMFKSREITLSLNLFRSRYKGVRQITCKCWLTRSFDVFFDLSKQIE